ncbi:MAG: RNA 2',3'-cyclic phosphodiesterase [Phycisphaerae bacterium]
MRCFVAIEIAESPRERLTSLIRMLASGERELRWVRQDQIHLTLKFLGEIDERDAPAACRIAQDAAAGISVFSLRLTKLGCFPSPAGPRVLWCGIDDESASCRRWLEAAEPGFEALGVPRESRAFSPHVTLARSKSPAGAAAIRRVLTKPAAVGEAFDAKFVTLFESRLSREGPTYSILVRCPFCGA